LRLNTIVIFNSDLTWKGRDDLVPGTMFIPVSMKPESPDSIVFPVGLDIFEEIVRRYNAAGWAARFDGTTLTIERREG